MARPKQPDLIDRIHLRVTAETKNRIVELSRSRCMSQKTLTIFAINQLAA